jgi:hypothetical protein
MKKALFALAAVLAAVSASAAEGGPQLGLGAIVGFGTTAITVPFNIAPGLRVEPFVGFARTKVTNSVNPAGDTINTDTTFSLGSGLYVVKEAAQNVELYGGGRIGLAFISEKVETPVGDNSDSFVGFELAAVGGAEYYFSPRFALGVEAELGLQTEETAVDVRRTDIFTASFVTAKVFFK